MKTKTEAPIPVTQFKAHCLAILDTVQRKRIAVIISKHGKPVARVVPIEPAASRPLHGFMKGTAREIGDIVAPLDEEWDANQD